MAESADRHELYQRAVQCVEAEIDFVDETYRTLRGRDAKLLREDFCGTANTSGEWLRRRTSNRAFGVDLDAQVLEWGQRYNLEPLGSHAQRCELVCSDVLTADLPPADVLLAMNFSYWLFEDRPTLKRYFEIARNNLASDGILFLDAFGGYECNKVAKDRHKYGDFTYIWDQAAFDPVTHKMQCHIHFRFPDGSKLDRAYSYEWRLWGLPEITELLAEAGFARTTVYWQGTDEDNGEAEGIFVPVEHGDADPAWLAYIVAEK